MGEVNPIEEDPDFTTDCFYQQPGLEPGEYFPIVEAPYGFTRKEIANVSRLFYKGRCVRCRKRDRTTGEVLCAHCKKQLGDRQRRKLGLPEVR